MNENRNMILAVVLSVVILVGYQAVATWLAPPPPQPAATDGTTGGTADSVRPEAPPESAIPAAPGVAVDAPAATTVRDRGAVIADSERVRILSKRLHGSINLVGGRIDDLTLIDYRETLDPKSPEIVVLSPPGAGNAYFAEFGWVASAGMPTPGPQARWQADRDVLEPNRPVTLSWDNGRGLVFKKTIGLDENFLFTITQAVENTGPDPVNLYPYGLVSRWGTPTITKFFILHEGLLGVFDKTLTEVDYEELREKGVVEQSSTGGWIGITDKYWLTALVADPAEANQTRFSHRREGGWDKYQTDFRGTRHVAEPGGRVTDVSYFFAGAKEVKLLDRYSDALGIERFDLAIDFGWFYFLTKPIFYALIFIHEHVGNFGIAIILLTVVIKGLFFPLANKSYQAMSKMKKLQPEMLKLRERFGDDKVRLNQEIMALYKREKANPASGCLPMLIQIPVFFSLYKVLFVTIEMRHAPFYGWIHDLSAPDPTTVFNLFGAIPWTPPDFLMIGIWPLIMGVTMWLQQKLNPQPADPVQAKIFMFLPIFFTFLLARFPAGLVIYWACNNALSILQQWVIMRRMGVT